MSFISCYSYREVFPGGLPREFSFICTFKVRKESRSPWVLLRIADRSDSTEFSVGLDPRRWNLELGIGNYGGETQLLAFNIPRVSE